MKIIALDIGAGTEDVLLYEGGKPIENCVKMILPSPSRVFAAKVREATEQRRELFIEGEIIGGGAFTVALKGHMENGLRVLMTDNAAYTIRNDLDEVRQLGIKIVQSMSLPKNFRGEKLRIEEVNLSKLEVFLKEFNESLLDVDVVAVAVQDHGVSLKGMSNRRFRLQKMKELLENDLKPENLAFREEEIPQCFLRMRSAVESSKRQLPRAKVLVMDTSPAAILGCLKDPVVEEADPVLAVNVGNGHTMAAIISHREIIGIMEHHTRLLNPRRIKRLLVGFADGMLSDEEVFKDGGHGLLFLKDSPGFSKIEKIAVTGPNRGILSETDLKVHFAAPAGDVMMTGPIGLVEATREKFSI